LSAPDFVRLAAQLATILLVAVLSGQALRALRQPSVLGEMLGGVILGPTLLGSVLPGAFAWLFSSSDVANAARESFTRLGMLFFLFVAGLQTDLTSLRRSARLAVSVGLAGTLVPVVAGIALVQALPLEFWGSRAAAAPAAFALFVGLNLANSALPVLARTLLDLGLMESRIGTTRMAAAVVTTPTGLLRLRAEPPRRGRSSRPLSALAPWRCYCSSPRAAGARCLALLRKLAAGRLHLRDGGCPAAACSEASCTPSSARSCSGCR
jgi:hypothetical protein